MIKRKRDIFGSLLGLPDAFCKNTSHFVNSARS